MSLRCFRLQSSKIDVSTFEDRCVDFRRSMIDVPTFEDRWQCVDLRRPMIDVKLCCHTCSKHWWYNCLRIAPRVCTSVLSFCVQLPFYINLTINQHKFYLKSSKYYIVQIKSSKVHTLIINYLYLLFLYIFCPLQFLSQGDFLLNGMYLIVIFMHLK